MAPRKKKEDAQNLLNSIPFDISSLSEENQLMLSVLLFSVNSNKEELLKKIEEKDTIIESLSGRVKELEGKLSSIEERLDRSEVEEKKCEIILSGQNIPECVSSENVTRVIQGIFRDNINYNLPSEKIVKCYRIGKKPSQPNVDRRSFLVKLTDENTKLDLISTNKANRPNGIYVNENLTAVRRSILYVLRRARKDFSHLISGCNSINGDVYVWIKSTDRSRDRRIMVNTFRKLDLVLSEMVDTSVSNYLPDVSI